MTVITKQVAAGGDDGYQFTGTFNATADFAGMGNSGGTAMRSFFRFTAVTIAVGSVSNSAKIQLRAYASYSSTTCNLNINFEAADNPAAPTTEGDLTGRSLGSTVAGNGVGSWTGGTFYDSPDLTEELQEVIDRAGWASGNAVQVHVRNNSSSTNAFRNASTYNQNSTDGAKLVVTYTAPVSVDFTDGAGAGDAVAAFSLTDSLDDASGLGDAVEGYDFAGAMVDAAGLGDAAESTKEVDAPLSDQAGIGDAVSGDGEIDVTAADGAGAGDSADAFNWTEWLADNLDKPVARYYRTTTGEADGETDMEVPISSFQARKQTGSSTYLSVVIPGIDYLDAISARANGDMIIEMAYLIDGVESIREEILRAEIEQINFYKGTGSRSVTLVGHLAQTFVAKESRLYNPIYSQRADGDLSYRFAVPDLWINPGDTARVGDDAFTVDAVIYMVSAGGGQTVMEVQ